MALFGKGRDVKSWNTHFPPEVDPVFYRRHHADLRAMDDQQALAHFESYGRTEGRQASPAALRHQFMKYLPAKSKALEIGPGADPVFRGATVSYFDVHTTEGMRTWARGVGKDPDRIPDVTYTSPNGDLSVIPDTFDFVFSSHCVEHQPDLIGHLNAVKELLNTGGIYAFIVPDGRFCFDALRPATSVGAVIEAHIEGHRRHTLANRIDHTVLHTHNDAGAHWSGAHGEPTGNAENIKAEISAWKSDSQSYVDTHAWQLTPPILRQILRWSSDTDLLTLSPLRIYDTPRGQFEFMVVLEHI